MKIQSFKVVGVRGFLTKDISFRDSVTFLIGINGSGKTTILDLMYGLLNPCLEKLLTISFKEITLVCEVEDDKVNSQSKNIQIVCKKQGDNVIIVYQDLETKSIVNILYQIFFQKTIISVTGIGHIVNWIMLLQNQRYIQRSEVFLHL